MMLESSLRFLSWLLAVVITAISAPAASPIGAALADGQPLFTARLRWEHASQANLLSSDALTLRNALGFTTAPVNGFQASVEVETVSSLGPRDHYNAAGTNASGAGHTVIADPPDAAINQAWVSYARDDIVFRIGRQRIVLDDARFIGDVGWRQNQQTYDAAVLSAAPVRDVTLFYSYLWRANRVFGDHARQPDFTGNSHALNARYSAWAFGNVTAYAYRLVFDNAAASSSTTVSADFAGSVPVGESIGINYRVRYATQKEAGANPVDYRADYKAFELGAAWKRLQFAAGWEALGSDAGRKGFSTPLATLHAHSGWADVFVNTPGRGLHDLYFSATVMLPHGLPLKVVYHDYKPAIGGGHYGDEWGAQFTHRFGRRCSALAKVVRFDASAPGADVTRFWLQCEFKL